MKLETLVDILGKVKGQHLIVKRTHSQHSTFKGFTVYVIELYSRTNKELTKVLSVDMVISPQMKDHADEIVEEMFVEKLFEYLCS